MEFYRKSYFFAIKDFAIYSPSQAAQQGFVVLIAMVKVVLNGKLPPPTKVTIMNRLISNLAILIKSRGSTTLPNLVIIVSAVALHVVVRYRGRVPFININFKTYQ